MKKLILITLILVGCSEDSVSVTTPYSEIIVIDGELEIIEDEVANSSEFINIEILEILEIENDCKWWEFWCD